MHIYKEIINVKKIENDGLLIKKFVIFI